MDKAKQELADLLAQAAEKAKAEEAAEKKGEAAAAAEDGSSSEAAAEASSSSKEGEQQQDSSEPKELQVRLHTCILLQMNCACSIAALCNPLCLCTARQ
jgi:hypothetical protein